MTKPAAPARRSQAERRGEAEDRLLRAAAELIAESGPAAVTLAKVGERAGYSRGLATYHFGNKPALLQSVADAVADGFAESLRVEQLPGAAVVDELLALVRVYFDVAVNPPVLNRARLVLIADSIAHTDAEARDIIVEAGRTFRNGLASRIATAAADHGIDADPPALAATLVGMLRGITFESMLDPTIDLAGVRREVEAFVTARFATVPFPDPTTGNPR